MLHTYYYRGKNKQGKTISGTLQAKTSIVARAKLRTRGIVVTRLVFKPQYFNKKKVSASDIALFTREIATLIDAGIPLLHCFDIIATSHSNQSVQELLLHIKQDIETGLTLNGSLRKHPQYFNELYCNLLALGEQSGTLELMFNKMAIYKEQSEHIKMKVKKALYYPLSILCIAFLMSIGLLVFVIPQFESLFKEFGAQLPAMTRWVITISKVFQLQWHLVVLFCIAACASLVHIKKYQKPFLQWIKKHSFKFPLIGSLFKKSYLAQFARTLSISLGAGVPLIEALNLVANTLDNPIYSSAIHQVKQDISMGQSLYDAIKNTHLFPHKVIEMITVGEESGSLEKMLHKIACFYEEEITLETETMSHLLEPITITLLGIIVGILIISMYLPLFKLGSII